MAIMRTEPNSVETPKPHLSPLRRAALVIEDGVDVAWMHLRDVAEGGSNLPPAKAGRKMDIADRRRARHAVAEQAHANKDEDSPSIDLL